MISVNWEVVPDGLAAYDLFFFFLGSGYYPSFSSANMFHMLSLNSEPSVIFLHNMKKESMKRGRTCGSSKTNCTCGKQQMKQLIIRKYKNREHSGLAVWRVQVRASNQTGTDDLYFLLWQYTFFCAFFQSRAMDHVTWGPWQCYSNWLWGLHQALIICVLKGQLDHFAPWTVAGWLVRLGLILGLSLLMDGED